MPLAIPPAGVGRLTLEGTDATANWANVFHVYAPGNILTDPRVAGLAQDIGLLFETNLFYANCSGGLGVAKATLAMSDGSTIVVGESALGFSGTDTGTPMPGAVSCVISWLGAWHYRGGKPRTYLPGLTTSWLNSPTQLDGGLLASQTLNALNTMTSIDAYSASDVPSLSLGVLLGNTPTSPGTFAPFTGVLCRQQIGSQRRRNH